METIENFFASTSEYPDVPLLLLRVVVGLVFIIAGRNKLKDVAGFSKDNGLPVPIGWGLIFAEISAGFGFVLGILPQLAALVIMATMVGSMYFHIVKWKSKYWAASGGWEYDLMLFTMASIVLVFGGGAVGLLPTL